MTESLEEVSVPLVNIQEEVLVVGGTYDGGIIGLSLKSHLGKKNKQVSSAEEDADEEKNKGIKGIFNMIFAFKAHLASIKDMDSRGNLLVTASTDETMRIYNLKTRCDSGMLTKHQGSVTYVCLSWNSKYLISCGEDKVVCIWRCANWDPVKSFDDIHEFTPISADFHPSMKLALTLDIEGNICMLDLLQGTLATKFTVPGLGKKGANLNRRFGLFTLIKFNVDGSYYAVLSQRELVISSITDDDDWYLSSSTANLGLGPVQITSFCWITNQIFLVGSSNGQFRMIQITRERLTELEIIFTFSNEISNEIKNPHLGNRIKGICTIGYDHLKYRDPNHYKTYGKLVTCDSSGIFVLFNFTLNLSEETGKNYCEFEIMDVFDSDNRITCMVIEDRNPKDPLSLTYQIDPDTQEENGCLPKTFVKGNKQLKVVKKSKHGSSTKKTNSKQ
ncbi:WD repeats-containing protein [Cryptosporidium ubiquitum]|uniref:WD repeats-containing protein n=1 Tax=Cryptosporidium ubiquitum TaxID=857276 RepID=A0A1J4MMU6_9CRYT|nr:WD repeats-containing protein [Cryptosporidium ubiquitum]OII75578.1 WD repeats-containing protein [Cryptosporidium ubiquitum]